MASVAYEEIVRQILALTASEQRRLLELLTPLILREDSPRPVRSLLELRGLGKEIWEGMDAQEYVNRERTSWNG